MLLKQRKCRYRFDYAVEFFSKARSRNFLIKTQESITIAKRGEREESERERERLVAACHVALHALPFIDRDDNDGAITGSDRARYRSAIDRAR